MAITKQQLVDQAAFLAGVEAKDTELSILIPRVLYRVTDKFAADESTRQLVTQSQILTLTNGVVTLPSNVMVKYVRFASIEDGAISAPNLSLAKQIRWGRSWPEFVSQIDTKFGYFIVRSVSGSPSLVMTEPGSAYDPTTGVNRDILLTAVCMPSTPTLPGAQLLSPTEFENEAILVLADALKNPSILLMPIREAA